jgi:tetratricopeptide (TPR) repeat protein
MYKPLYIASRCMPIILKNFLIIFSIAAVFPFAMPSCLSAQIPDSISRTLHTMPPSLRLRYLMDLAESEQRSQLTLAQKLYSAAAALADSLNDLTAKMDALNGQASLYLQQEDYTPAQNLLQQAVQMKADGAILDTLIIDTYTLLGIVFERTGKYNEALDFLRKAGVIQQRLKSGPEARAKNLTNIAHVYEEQGLFQKAIDTYKVALWLCKENDIAFGQALLNQNLANAYNALGKFAESIGHSQQSLSIARQQNMVRIMVGTYQNLGASYLGQGALSTSVDWYKLALEEAQKIQYTKALLDASYQLSVLYEKMDQPGQAFRFLQQHTTLKDSVFSAEKTEKIEALQAAFQSEQKEAAIRELQQENLLVTMRQERTNLFFMVLVVLLGMGGWLIWYRQQQTRKLAIQQRELERLQQEQELQALERDKMLYELNALKAQMNPHFLFNALNSIQELFMTGESRQANEYLGKFSDLTRNILHASGLPVISLREEMQMLSDYLDLEGLRFSTGFTYKIEAQDSLAVDEIEIPPMLVQPYVENAIKHGLMHRGKPRTLHVFFSMEISAWLKVQVTDNGVGRKQAAYFASLRHDRRHNRFATSATQKRLELLNHGRPERITVQYDDLVVNGDPAGTRVTIQIPLEDE